jgi:hypothetical protein
MISEENLKIIAKTAVAHGLSPELIAKIVMVESGGDTWACRFEKHWRWFLNPMTYARLVQVSKITETVCQQMSWGLMQCMGTVARECGFREDLPKLCHPEVGVLYGCKKFRSCLSRYNGNVFDALAAYNAGHAGSKAGQNYAYKVISVKLSTEEIKFLNECLRTV